MLKLRQNSLNTSIIIHNTHIPLRKFGDNTPENKAVCSLILTNRPYYTNISHKRQRPMFISFLSKYTYKSTAPVQQNKRGSLGANERLYVTPVRERRREREREREVILKCGRMKTVYQNMLRQLVPYHSAIDDWIVLKKRGSRFYSFFLFRPHILAFPFRNIISLYN